MDPSDRMWHEESTAYAMEQRHDLIEALGPLGALLG